MRNLIKKEHLNQVVKLCLLLVVGTLLVGCAKVPLYTDLEEREVNEMIAILSEQGIASTKVKGEEKSWSITIEAGKMAEAVDILNAYGYPHDKFQSIGEAFKKSGLVSSPSEERIRYMYALSQGLAETLSQIDGVLTARVHVVLQNNDPLAEIRTPSSASVFLKYRRGAGVENLSPQIKRLVANSIEGLSYEKVSLIFIPSDVQAAVVAIEKKEAVEEVQDMRVWLIVGLVGLLVLIASGTAGYWYWQGKEEGLDKMAREEKEE